MRAERIPDHGAATIPAGGSVTTRRARGARAVDVEKAIRRCVGRLRGPSSERIVVFVTPGLKAQADAEAFDAILSALLSNALKFAPPRSPIHVTAVSDEIHLVISVRDSGAGVPPGERERILRPPEGDGPSSPRRGLELARELVELHGGRLWVERAPEGGAAFSFTLPRMPGGRGPRAVPAR
jgi:two-component system phosphate regulon sensor histidine kinase PhoR